MILESVSPYEHGEKYENLKSLAAKYQAPYQQLLRRINGAKSCILGVTISPFPQASHPSLQNSPHYLVQGYPHDTPSPVLYSASCQYWTNPTLCKGDKSHP